MDMKICVLDYCVAKPQLVLIIIPIFIILFFVLKHTFVEFKDKERKEVFIKKSKGIRAALLFTRTLVFLFFLMALATPYTEKQITTPGSPSLTILADNSTSFEMFDGKVAQELALKLKEKIPVNLKYIAAGDKSAIGDGMLATMQGDDNILVVTDGNNNHGRVLGDVIMFASRLNTSVSALDISPVKKDVSVRIEGPYEVIEGEENQYTVAVDNVGGMDYILYVEVDSEKILYEPNMGSFTFSRAFSEGYHRIKASVELEDHFHQNNVFYKAVKSVKQPKVLFVSEKTSPLFPALSGTYDLDSVNELPDSLDEYYAVILNDIKGNKLDAHMDKLTAYVSDGNGLMVVGGESSYSSGFYATSLIESLLPVKIGVPEMSETQGANIVFLIDVSDTTANPFRGSAGNSVLDVEKAIALGLINTLRLDDRVGVIALHATSQVITPLVTLIDEKERLVNDIKRMQSGGGTNFVPALRRAQFLMDGQTGTKNAILITDGIEYSTRVATLSTIEWLAEQGVVVHTVGIGQFTDEPHLQKIAELGNGLYFKPEETQQLNLLFSRPTVPETEEEGKTYGLVFLDKNHWITKGNISVKGQISGFNYVTPKVGSRTLLITDAGNPVISVGRFGLGRVVAFSTDDGSKWSGGLLSSENSKVITRTINWAIGDLSRKKEFDVGIKDVAINKPVRVTVVSEGFPKSELEFSKVGDKLYLAEYFAGQQGFNEMLGAVFAVNYNDEYLDIGLNPELEDTVIMTGGRIFKPDDVDSIVEAVKTFSKRTSTETVSLRWPFVLAALLIFIIDIGIRRIREFKLK